MTLSLEGFIELEVNIPKMPIGRGICAATQKKNKENKFRRNSEKNRSFPLPGLNEEITSTTPSTTTGK